MPQKMGDMFNENVIVFGGDVLDGNVSGRDVSEGDIFDGNASGSTGNYGGTKKVTFKIKGKKIGFLWW